VTDPRVNALSSSLRCLLLTTLLIVSGRSDCDPVSGDDAGPADAADGECASVVLVNCTQAPQQATAAPSSIGATNGATKQKLEANRLKQAQGQVTPNAIEITAERPAGAPPDPWEVYRQSLASAATPDCLAPSVQGGLLRMPYLLHQAVVGKCR
jgi:hypothetical protein